ncbi:hypothetical protein DYB25_007691, partial [Aphanomyces astaci]
KWGIKKIQAPALWAKAIKGDGINVANIDTGVRYTHESLESNWPREYGWFNPYSKTKQLPSDTDGHGTHAPHVINGSFGEHRTDFFLQDTITMWREAGIIPVFASGNKGLKAVRIQVILLRPLK